MLMMYYENIHYLNNIIKYNIIIIICKIIFIFITMNINYLNK